MFLERSVINFQCVMVDHTYREKLVVHNGASTAMKVSVPNRADVADYFEFSPNFGFVQVRCGSGHAAGVGGDAPASAGWQQQTGQASWRALSAESMEEQRIS